MVSPGCDAPDLSDRTRYPFLGWSREDFHVRRVNNKVAVELGVAYLVSGRTKVFHPDDTL